MKHVKLPKLEIRKRSDLSERWVQQILTDDPALLGLGDLDVRDVERRQPRAGRLDMLLTDSDGSTRYEVELQLGPTDESHIIRTLEYWDTERRRYPQYEHVAVIVAEEITSRFFNVISLFNGFIPIVAIQMTALEVAEQGVALVFTKVLDHVALGTEEDDGGVPTTREDWEKRSTPEIMRQVVDRIHKWIEREDERVALKYNKHYIGLAKDGVANNYVAMKPRKGRVVVEFRIQQSEEVTAMIDEAGIGTLPYKWGSYRVTIPNKGVLVQHRELLHDLIRRSRGGN